MKNYRWLYAIVVIAILLSSIILAPIYASSKPHIEITSPQEGETFAINSTITLTANITDADSSTLTYFLSIDKKLLESGKTSTGTFTKYIKINTPGSHIIALTVLDEDSNYDVAQITVNIVNNPPVVKILYPANNTATTATAITLSLTASDKDTSTLSLKITNNGNIAYSGTINTTNVANIPIPLYVGKNLISAYVSDGYSETSTSIVIYRKLVIAHITYPQDGQTLTLGTVPIQAEIFTSSVASYVLMVDNKLIKTGTTTGGTISATTSFTATGYHTISLLATTGSYTASDSITVYVAEKPQISLVFPKLITSGRATLTITSNMEIPSATLLTDNIHIQDIAPLPKGSTVLSIQTQLITDKIIHTISIKIPSGDTYSATFTATGAMPHIYDIGTPTKTEDPSIDIDPSVDTASVVYIHVGNNFLGIAPQTFTPSQDGTYTIAVNAIGGNNFSVWKTATVTFVWAPILNIKDAYWHDGKLALDIEVTDYDKDTDMLTIYPIGLYYPIHMEDITQVFTVDIPQSYITIGSTLTIEAHDASGLTSTITFIVPGKIPAPHIVSPDPHTDIKIFQDSIQVTVEVSATGTIYWYQDGLLTKKQPAPKPGRYTYMFFTDEIKKYEIYARLCDGVSCSPKSETLIVRRGAIVKLWVGKTLYFANGKMSNMDVSPFIDPRFNRTVVPIRFVGNALGYKIGWNPDTRDVILTKDNLQIVMNMKVRDKVTVDVEGKKKTLYIGSATVSITENGETKLINLHNYNGQDMGEPVIVDSRTFVPVRFLSEILGAKVTWDPRTRGIGIFFIP
ncbi:MAG: copper amine oxidase N-terminal domain-containing protein [Dictyoglomi bacterium]|nr:copper amine oxidase N-terminal domain-containing protein [Dictyoglomota bacterium]